MTRPPAESLLQRARRTGRPIVLLHIGETKTGTTFLQDVMWANRAALAGSGVQLPGFGAQDHHRAARDLRGVPWDESDPGGSWVGEWDVLASQVVGAGPLAVISQEALVVAGPEPIARAITSLTPAEVHVAVTVRDLASLLPAEWQENVKNGGTREWGSWLTTVLESNATTPAPARSGFWRLHDTVSALQRWTQHVPAERVHVVTVPAAGAGAEVLWQRWATLLGVAPGVADTASARANRSLGFAETEFLRRVNEQVGNRVPTWFYETRIKAGFAEGLLPGTGAGGRPPLTVAADAAAQRYAKRTIAALRQLRVDVVGELDELRPADHAAGGDPGVPERELTDVAARVVAELLVSPEAALAPRSAGAATVRDRLVAWIGSSPRAKRTIRNLTARYPSLARLRVVAWRWSRAGRRAR